jgi:hypothetical protein
MTPEQYLDRTAFPLTTKPGLSVREQLMWDVYNYDQLQAAQKTGKPLSDEEQKRLAELTTKAQHRSEVIRQLGAV